MQRRSRKPKSHPVVHHAVVHHAMTHHAAMHHMMTHHHMAAHHVSAHSHAFVHCYLGGTNRNRIAEGRSPERRGIGRGQTKQKRSGSREDKLVHFIILLESPTTPGGC
ncbi:MAG: hypothetical protein NVSMB26_11460 [Beijerinckiaceae bacterium]